MDEYRDPIIDKIIEKLEAEGPAELRGKYYNGDVLLVPKSELPICSIAKDTTRIFPADNMTDDNLMPLVLNVLYDYTSDLDQSSDLVAGVNGLYKMLEGRGAGAGPYDLNTDSLAYVLRKYQTLDAGNNLWLQVGPNEETAIDYGLGIERRGPGIFSVEGVIRFSARVHTTRPGV